MSAFGLLLSAFDSIVVHGRPASSTASGSHHGSQPVASNLAEGKALVGEQCAPHHRCDPVLVSIRRPSPLEDQ